MTTKKNTAQKQGCEEEESSKGLPLALLFEKVKKKRREKKKKGKARKLTHLSPLSTT